MMDRLTRRLNAVLLSIALVVLVAGAATASYLALRSFEESLIPEMDQKAVLIGRTVTEQISRAVDVGLRFERLVGMDALLNQTVTDITDLEYLVVTNLKGHILYAGGPDPIVHAGIFLPTPAITLTPPDFEPGSKPLERLDFQDIGLYRNTAMPIMAGAGVEAVAVGILNVGMSRAYARQKLAEISYDLMVVLFVSLLVTFELLVIVVSAGITRPIQVVQAAMRRVAAGDLREPSRTVRETEQNRIVQLCNTAVHRLNERYRQIKARSDRSLLRPEADTPAEAETEAGPLRRLAGSLTPLERRYRFGDDRDTLAPRETGDNSLAYVRAPLFTFMLSEELSRSFFPVYAAGMTDTLDFLPIRFAVALPLSLFMLIVALSQPIAGRWSERIGRRRALLIGAFCGACGQVLTATATTMAALLAWKGLCGIGYGIVFITCQGYVAAHTTTENRAQGMGVFVTVIMSAILCGPAIGGILADRIGHRPTFVLAGAVALLSALLITRLIRPGSETPSAMLQRRLTLDDIRSVLGDRRLMALMLCAAVPGKMILTGFLYFLVPLYLHEMGESQSTVGRFIMAFGIIMVFLTPLTARLADRLGARIGFVVLGGLIAGSGTLAALVGDSPWPVLTAIVALGLAQALSTAPMLAMVPEISDSGRHGVDQTTVIGIFRLIERLGSAIGPFAAAALLTIFGYAWAIAGLGLIVAGLAIVLLLVFATHHPPSPLAPVAPEQRVPETV